MLKKLLRQGVLTVLALSILFSSGYVVPLKQASANSAASENIALHAVSGTSAASGSGYSISAVNDGNDTTPWASTPNTTLPQYITLGFSGRAATISSLSLVCHYAKEQGITQFDLEYYDKGVWITARSNIQLTWQTTGLNYETKDVVLPAPVTGSAFRIKVTAANRVWGNFTVDEIKLWGTLSTLEGYTFTRPIEDITNVIKNPAMGWAIYFDQFGSVRFPTDPAQWWSSVDPYTSKASILYMRVPWSQLEPEEGKYAWIYNQNYKDFVRMARDRGLKLGIRVYVDGKDAGMQATPEFVKQAGCKGYTINPGNSQNNTFWTPYLYDQVFQQKFTSFVTAFSKEYNNPDIVDYIDAQGLGWWGEMHNVDYLTTTQRSQVFKWVTDLYQTNFDKVLLGDQYGPNSFSYTLHDAKLNDGWIIRRDSFGSPKYLPESDKDKIKSKWPVTPVFAESCYQMNWPESWKGEGFATVRDLGVRTINDAKECHANTLDLRNPGDAKIWVEQLPDLVQDFAMNCGYRFVITGVNYPVRVNSSSAYTITHSWKNSAVGKLPNNNRGWNHKYKVSIALLDKVTGNPVWKNITGAEPSDWIKDGYYSYDTAINFTGVPVGNYELAIAVTDSSKGHSPAINLAVESGKTTSGWYKIGNIDVLQ